MKFTVHTIVKNEDSWVWFALKSVLPYASEVLVFDTGSNDKTVEVVKAIGSPKIVFEEKGAVDRDGLVKLRQEQIARTKTEWFLIVDGDEIWPEAELMKLLRAAESAKGNTVAIFNRNRNCVGDVYHYLPDESGKYCIGGKTGHLTIRMMRKTKDLGIEGKYPLESYANSSGPIEKQDERLRFVDCWYLHASLLKRSSADRSQVISSFNRTKVWEKGIEMQKGELPEVLFLPRPQEVAYPLVKRGQIYEIMAGIISPMLYLRRNWRGKE